MEGAYWVVSRACFDPKSDIWTQLWKVDLHDIIKVVALESQGGYFAEKGQASKF